MTDSDGTVPRTLASAHQTHMRSWPGEDGSAAAFVAYYRRGAVLFAAVAQIDTDHRQEATWWAGECRRLAEGYAADLASVPADDVDSPGDAPTGSE